MHLLTLHKQFLTAHIKEGSRVCDFTMGNGHDTLFLAKAVGPTGHVTAFDIQPAAVENTQKRLLDEGVLSWCELICESHANLAEYVKEPFDAGVFNLGWLPGSDKTVTTMRTSTEKAVRAAVELIAPGGILLVAVYPGHPEGRAEGELLTAYFSTLDRYTYSCTRVNIVNTPDAPFFFAIERRDG